MAKNQFWEANWRDSFSSLSVDPSLNFSSNCVCVCVCAHIIYITISPRWVSTLPPFLQEDSGTCLHKTLNQIHGHFQKSLSSVSTNIYLQAKIMEDHGRGITQFTIWATCQGRLMQLEQSSFSVPLKCEDRLDKGEPRPSRVTTDNGILLS